MIDAIINISKMMSITHSSNSLPQMTLDFSFLYKLTGKTTGVGIIQISFDEIRVIRAQLANLSRSSLIVRPSCSIYALV
jgi:hypothetical protein